MIRFHLPLAIALVSVLATACESPIGLAHEDVDRAYAAWRRNAPTRYVFKVAHASSWHPKSEYLEVTVENRRVVLVREADGATGGDFGLTVDSLWVRILDARDRDQLNAATFDRRGVPVDIDYGPWEVDGGMRFWIREFRPTQ